MKFLKEGPKLGGSRHLDASKRRVNRLVTSETQQTQITCTTLLQFILEFRAFMNRYNSIDISHIAYFAIYSDSARLKAEKAAAATNGCRPNETAAIDSREVNFRASIWVLREDKAWGEKQASPAGRPAAAQKHDDASLSSHSEG